MRHPMRWLAASLFFLTFGGCPTGFLLSAENPPLMQISAKTTIVISSDATPTEKFAARELQEHLEKISGAKFNVAGDSSQINGPKILVGNSRSAARLAPDVDFSRMGSEEFIIRTIDGNLILAGGRPRGSMYAVYEFLEKYLGCRWFASDCVKIPKLNPIVIPSIDERIKPTLESRTVTFAETRGDNLWCARNRINGHFLQNNEGMGGKIKYPKGLFVHTFYVFVPPSKYFKEHPEYFSEINGKREAGKKSQLCLSNPEVAKLTVEAIKNLLRQEPDINIIPLSQNDVLGGFCTCPACSKIAGEEDGQSGVLLRFVNQVADMIKDEFPRVSIETLAYQYTRKPPKLVRPRPNVIIRLCSIECCFAHPHEVCPFNQTFVKDVIDWAKICGRLYIWDYTIDFCHYLAPFPNLRVISPNINFFINHRAKGILEQGTYPENETRPGIGGESAWLRSYLIAKCLWNPGCDPSAAMNEFLENYYGGAASHVRKYYDLIHDEVEARQFHVKIGDHPSGFLTLDLLDRCDRELGRAEKLVCGNAVFSKRLQQLRMWPAYARLCVAPAQDLQRRENRLCSTAIGKSYEGLLENFYADVQKFGVKNVRECEKPFAPAEWIKTNLLAPTDFKTVVLENPTQLIEIVPEAGGRIFRWLDKRTKRQFLHESEGCNGKRFFTGGYEEYSRHFTPAQPYKINMTGKCEAELSTAYYEGGVVSRKYSLDREKPILHINTSLTCPKKKPMTPITGLIRTQSLFDLGNPADCELRWMAADGQWKSEKILASKEFKKSEPARHPNGQWSVCNRHLNIEVLNRFDPSQAEELHCRIYPDKNCLSLELWSPVRELKPGESIHINQSFEIRNDQSPP
ncbi:MAG: DUF4838 domain-containing protein [Verrucomicrobiae bacterium]|nr:DUF4838 domain-containing protein [Verrucomicrobiae bacterium]